MPQLGIFEKARPAPPLRRPILFSTIASFAVLAHLAFLAILPVRWQANQSTDYFLFYEPVARNLVIGNGLIGPDGAPALLYPPGFPLQLAGAFAVAEALNLPEALVLRLQIAFCVALTAVLIYLIAEHVLGWWIAIAAVFLWSTYPLQLWLTKQPDSGHIFALLFLLAVYLFLRSFRKTSRTYSACFVVGLVIGFSTLLRPIGIGLSLVFLLAERFFAPTVPLRKWAIPAIFLVAGNLVAILPWEVWAWHAGGHWIPISTNGPPSMLDGITLSAVRQPVNLSLPDGVEDVIQEYVANRHDLTTTGELLRFTAVQTRRHPLAMVELGAIKAARSWYATDSKQFETTIALLQVPYLLLGFWGLALGRKDHVPKRSMALFVMLLIGYFWGMSFIALSIVRYMLPVMTLILIFAAAALSTALALLSRPA